MATLAPADRARSNLFDVVRFSLAALVIYSHAYALLAGSDATEPLHRWSGGQISWGGLAVDSFFILSGYLVTQSWLASPKLGDYLRKRALRIYPGFVVAVLLSVALVAPLSTGRVLSIDSWQLLWGVVGLNGYTTPDVFADNPLPGVLNGSLWSIRYEFWCYVGIALLGLLGWLRRRGVILALFCAALAVSVVFDILDLEVDQRVFNAVFGYPPLWARMLPYYLAGTVLFLYKDQLPRSRALAFMALLLLFVGALLPPWGVALLFPLALGYLWLFIVFTPVPRLTRFAKYGDFSYGLYLYAFPIEQLIVRHWPQLSPLSVFAFAAPVTLACAVVSWHAIEKPCLKLKPLERWQRLRAYSTAAVPSEGATVVGTRE